jgi:hypothetical protein
MSVMQGFERAGRQLLDAAALAGHLVPAGSMFAFLAGHRAQVFPDAEYADLFSPPGVGRPSLPATQMAAVLTLQALHDYSDRETAEAVKFDVRWKAAIGVPLDDPGFDPSSLVYWRRRLAKSERPRWWPRSGTRTRRSRPPPRWRFWRWSPGRTWSPLRAPTAGTGGGGSPARAPKTG